MERYSAMQIVLYCIYYCSQKLQNSVSNLHLQKILYYIQAKFLVETGGPCFREPIVAWKYGPVVESVYYELKRFANSRLRLEIEPDDIEDEDKRLIEEVCDVKAILPAGLLVNHTHKEDPWKNAEQSQEIALEDIMEYFSSHPDQLG